jgi:NodT family efflux transporter outer membrane factor (OMF) lipoprotein
MSTVRTVAAAALAGLMLSACATPRGLAPQARVRGADELKSGQALAMVPSRDSAWPQAQWWTALGDRQLDQLIEEALRDSPTLEIAQARTRRALAQAGVENAALYPQLTANASTTREEFPGHSLIPPPYAGSWNSLSDLSATLSWELDLWGKNRAARASAVDEARAAAIDASAARLALSVSIAHAYVQLQRAYLQLDVAQATLAQREQIYSLTQERNAAGLDSRLELKQAESALPQSREQIAQLNELIELTRNELAALLGQGPDRGLAIERPAASELTEFALPSRVPAELLGRRPDLIAERWRIEAARQNITGARAAFYPDVNLAALVGFQSLGPSGLLTAASREVGVGPALSLPLFDAGRRRAELAARDAEYDADVEQYNQTLADALRQVVDQLASMRSVSEQRTQQREGLATAQEAYDLAILRYREGVGNYLQVLTTQTQLLEQRSLDADLRARALDLSVNLVQALGGGLNPESKS